MLVTTLAYPRAGLVGNPSDAYFGRTIAFTFSDFSAQVEMWESPELELLPSRRDHSVFQSIQHLHQDVQQHGYYGGFRLLKATCKRFYDYCAEQGITLDDRNFTLRYRSDIPGRVGLAGSSAIITACLRALMAFFSVQISRHALANLVLSVEQVELVIPAGLQDRVAQAYGGLTYMDFKQSLMEQRGYGEYLALDPRQLPPLYIAYHEMLSEGTEVLHNGLRARFLRGEKPVLAAIARWAELAAETRALLQENVPGAPVPPARLAALHALLNENFDLRASLCDLSQGNLDLVKTARQCGVSAKFAGSGGAIVGFMDSPAALAVLEKAFADTDVRVFCPTLV
ncbi:MAG: GHMP kinase [Candidatus Marinimicrobia bacterium]|nr:GHMP kinase [Candidatus Neomarinimicrobiota bacterium]